MVEFVISPIRYFRHRRTGSWTSAIGAVVSYTVLVAIGSALTSEAVDEATATVLRDANLPTSPMGMNFFLAVAMSVATIPSQVALNALLLIACSLLLTGVGNAPLLWRFIGESYWSQSLWVFLSIIAVVLWFAPEHFTLPRLDQSEVAVLEALTEYQRRLSFSTFELTMRMVSMYFGLWLVGLQCCALRVASGVTRRQACAIWIFISSLFVVTPWAIGRFQ